MVQWADFPLDGRMVTSQDEAVLSRAVASIENAVGNLAGGHSRLPGMEWFVKLDANRVYLKRWRNNLYAGTDRGRLYRISSAGVVEDVTGVPISGGKRWTFDIAENPDMLVMAAGGPIVKLAAAKTELLSAQAPNTTHVIVIDGYVLAIEAYSNRFRYSDPLQADVWNPISVFSANAKIEDATCMIVTPYREVLIGGNDHIEQFEPIANGVQPFARRWSTGQGIGFPYTFVADATGTYGVNDRFEFVRFFGQVSQEKSGDVRLTLEEIDDWTDAWASEVVLSGGRYLMLQMPFATNAYGTPGVTMLLEYTNNRWSFAYGPTVGGSPTRYPAWSFERAWNRTYVGVAGGVAVIEPNNFQLFGEVWPCLIRSGHVSKFGPSRIDDLRLRLKRGTFQPGAILRDADGIPIRTASGKLQYSDVRPTEPPLIGLRVNRDNEGFANWMYEPMGAEGESDLVAHFGGMGTANTWQFELRCSANVALETAKMEVYVERLRW